jgi:hypothetical protein
VHHFINSGFVDHDRLIDRSPRPWCVVWNKQEIELAFFFVGAVLRKMITSHDGILNLFALSTAGLRYHTEAYRVGELSWRRMTPRYTVWCEGWKYYGVQRISGMFGGVALIRTNWYLCPILDITSSFSCQLMPIRRMWLLLVAVLVLKNTNTRY